MHQIFSTRLRTIVIGLLAAASLGGCRVEEDEYPEVILPAPAPPPPAPVTTPTDTSQVLNDTAHWRHFDLGRRAFESPAPGRFEFGSDGVRGYNSTPNFGSFLATAYAYDLANREIRVTWMCNDGGATSDFALALADSSGELYDPGSNQPRFRDLNKLSTRSSYGGSTVVLNNVWYFSIIRCTGNQYTVNTAMGAFPDDGGQLIDVKSGSLLYRRGRVVLRSVGPGRAGCTLVVNRLSIR